jgi:hypothetical protein
MPLDHHYSPSPHASCRAGCPSVGGQRAAWCSRSVSQAARHVGCPSFGGQRASGFSPRVKHRWFQWWQQLPQGNTVAATSRVQVPHAFKRCLRLAGQVALAARRCSAPRRAIAERSPNPSVKRTVNGGPRSVVSGKAGPPLSAAYLQR